jgi:hypothetical protein
MKYFQDDFFRKMVLSAALLGMASSLAIAQDQAAPRPPGAQQMPVPLPAPQDPSGGELRLPPGPPPRGADFEPGAGSRRSESLVQMPGVVGRYLLNVFGEVDGARRWFAILDSRTSGRKQPIWATGWRQRGFERIWNLQCLRHLLGGDGTIRQWGIGDDPLWG